MQLLKTLRENSALVSQLNKLEMNTKSQRDIFNIQQSNSISSLSRELENYKFRVSKLEAEVDHYKKIYRELTQKYNREKSEKHAQHRRGESQQRSQLQVTGPG